MRLLAGMRNRGSSKGGPGRIMNQTLLQFLMDFQVPPCHHPIELMASSALSFSHSGGVLTCARPWLLKPWVGGRCVGAISCRFQHPWAITLLAEVTYTHALQ